MNRSQLASALAKLRKRDTQMTCPRCSKQFVGYSKGQRYCSARCQSQATSAAHRANRKVAS